MPGVRRLQISLQLVKRGIGCNLRQSETRHGLHSFLADRASAGHALRKGTREFALAALACGIILTLSSFYVVQGEMRLRARGLLGYKAARFDDYYTFVRAIYCGSPLA